MDKIVEVLLQKDRPLFGKLFNTELNANVNLTPKEKERAEIIFTEVTGKPGYETFINGWRRAKGAPQLMPRSASSGSTVTTPLVIQIAAHSSNETETCARESTEKKPVRFDVNRFITKSTGYGLNFKEIPETYEPYRRSVTEKTDRDLRSIARHVVALNSACNVQWLSLQGERHEL